MKNQLKNRFKDFQAVIRNSNPIGATGQVASSVGIVIEVEGLKASVGDMCWIETGARDGPIRGEVVGFRDNKLLLMPLGRVTGIGEGNPVYPTEDPLSIQVGEELLGRVIGGTGKPQDNLGPISASDCVLLSNFAPLPLERKPINRVLETGVKVIDSVLTCGKGQRMGVFAGSGLGKSILLGMICKNAVSDVNVIALIGERGREVREFVENLLGPDGLKKSVVVAVTSDRSPVMRVKGAETAMSIAEYFRDRGRDVLFIMDSITRYAMAQREIGLAVGEPPTARGYTPSVFAKLPSLLERAGNGANGSITGIYSVLVEGDDISADPLTDAVRAILDGHIVLSRKLANAGYYPAIDILQSISRLAPELLNDVQKARRDRILQWYATYRGSEDLINIGAYEKGSNPQIDESIDQYKCLMEYFRQGIKESFPMRRTESELSKLVDEN